MFLLDRLDRLKCAVKVEEAEDAMYEFSHGLLDMRILKEGLQQQFGPTEVTLFNKGDETMLQDLHAHGAIYILLDAIRRFMGVASPEFLNSACIALMHFAFQSKERSRYMYRCGGFGVVIELMQCYRSVDYIQIICIALMMVIGKNVGISLFLLETPILCQIVLAMEHRCESSKVYTVACSALVTLFGPGSSFAVMGCDDENDLYHRALGAICYGLVLHLDDSTAIDAGNTLLRNIVGPNVAEEMVNEAERDHCGGTHVAAAAA
jgi:hypothetical protein